MTNDYSNQAFAFFKQFADNTFKAQALALKNAQTVSELQMKALERQAQNSSAFFADAMEARDMDSMRALWEKGTNLGRNNAEQAVAVSQEIYALTQKTAESFTTLVQDQQQAANDAVAAPATSGRKAASK